MPTYDYRCSACKHEFEQFQSMTAKPLKTCPKCGKKALERLIGTGAALVFKGSGFYQTDYRSDSYKKAASADTSAPTPAPTSASTPAASATAGATDAKPAAKDTKPAAETKPAKPSKPAKP